MLISAAGAGGVRAGGRGYSGGERGRERDGGCVVMRTCEFHVLTTRPCVGPPPLPLPLMLKIGRASKEVICGNGEWGMGGMLC